jgi:hypothetical protein
MDTRHLEAHCPMFDVQSAKSSNDVVHVQYVIPGRTGESMRNDKGSRSNGDRQLERTPMAWYVNYNHHHKQPESSPQFPVNRGFCRS